jgi:hypothetical protein
MSALVWWGLRQNPCFLLEVFLMVHWLRWLYFGLGLLEACIGAAGESETQLAGFMTTAQRGRTAEPAHAPGLFYRILPLSARELFGGMIAR